MGLQAYRNASCLSLVLVAVSGHLGFYHNRCHRLLTNWFATFRYQHHLLDVSGCSPRSESRDLPCLFLEELTSKLDALKPRTLSSVCAQV